MLGGLATAVRVDAGVLAHQRGRVVTEALGHFRDAVPRVRLAGGEQVPYLVRTDRTHSCCGCDNRLFTVSGRSGRPAHSVIMYSEARLALARAVRHPLGLRRRRRAREHPSLGACGAHSLPDGGRRRTTTTLARSAAGSTRSVTAATTFPRCTVQV